MNKLRNMDWLAIIILAVGGLNWGLVGLLDFDLVAAIFGEASGISRIVYVVVGIEAVYVLVLASKLSRKEPS